MWFALYVHPCIAQVAGKYNNNTNIISKTQNQNQQATLCIQSQLKFDYESVTFGKIMTYVVYLYTFYVG